MKNLPRLFFALNLGFAGVTLILLGPLAAERARADLRPGAPDFAAETQLRAAALVTITTPPGFGANPLLAPASGAVLTTTRPTFDWADASGDYIVSYTLRITGPVSTLTFTSTTSAFTPATGLPSQPYSWTVQAHNIAGDVSGFVSPPYTFTINAAPAFSGNPLIAPAGGATFSDPVINFDWADASGEVLNYTLRITGSGSTRNYVTTSSAATVMMTANDAYSWTVRAQNAAGESTGFVNPRGFSLAGAVWRIYLPGINKAQTCPTSSGNSYDLIPIEGDAADRPGPEHADLNLALRGYNEIGGQTVLVGYNGATDFNAPQLAGLFEPNNYPGITNLFQVNNWDWVCGTPEGCRSNPITDWGGVQLIQLNAPFGTRLNIPERGPEIYGGGYKAMVLYAEENRITLGYTRDDTVGNGYAVHLENICVDPALLALYRAQTDATGWHVSGWLPALKNDQQLGTAFLDGVRVAIRDRGTFMDPRSQKDWWFGYTVGLEIQQSHETLSK